MSLDKEDEVNLFHSLKDSSYLLFTEKGCSLTVPSDQPPQIPKRVLPSKILKETATTRACWLLQEHSKGVKEPNSNGQRNEKIYEALRHSFTSPQDVEIFHIGEEIHRAAVKYKKVIVAVQSEWQAEAEALGVLLTRWDGYNKAAETANALLSTLPPDSIAEIFGKEYFTDEEATLKFDGDRFTADIEGENGLYSKIESQRQRAKLSLEILQATILPFQSLMYTKGTMPDGESFYYFWFMPMDIEDMLREVFMLELDCDSINEKFFAYHLRQKTEMEEAVRPVITPLEERLALIPDPATTQPDREHYCRFSDLLDSYFEK